MALEEEVGSESRGETQEKAGTGEGVVVLFLKRRRQKKKGKATT